MMAEFRMEQDSDREQVKALWQDCFHDSPGFCQWFFEERWKPEWSAVASVSGRIAAAVQGWPYRVNLRGIPVPGVMMSGVSTAKEFRGRGLMKGCINLFSQIAGAKGAAAVIYTPVNFKVYRSLKHYPCSDACFISGSGQFPMPDGASDSRCGDGFSHELLPVYTRELGRYSGSVFRTPGDMSLKLRDYASDGGRLMIIRRGRETAAYAVYYLAETGLVSPEFAAPPRCRDELLAALGARAEGRPMSVRLPPDRADGLPPGFGKETRPAGAIGAVNISELLKSVCGYGDISIEVDGRAYLMDGSPFEGTAHMAMNPGRLMQLIAGCTSVERLAQRGEALIYDSSAARELDRRMPMIPCFTADEY